MKRTAGPAAVPQARCRWLSTMSRMHADDLVNRRRFLLSAGALGVAAPGLAAAAAAPGAAATAAGTTLPVALRVNGQTRSLTLDARTTLLDALRDHLGLTGS